MADPKSSGSEAGVDNARPSPIPPADPPEVAGGAGAAVPRAEWPAGRFLSLIQQLAGQAAIGVAEMPPTHPAFDRLLASFERFATDVAIAIAGIRMANSDQGPAETQQPPRKPPGNPADEVDDDEEDDDTEKDVSAGDERRYDVDDLRSIVDERPLEAAINAEVSRLHLIDSVLAGLDASLNPEECHLTVQRVWRGDPQDLVCLCRRMLSKSIENFDSVYIGPLIEKEREDAIATSRVARRASRSSSAPLQGVSTAAH